MDVEDRLATVLVAVQYRPITGIRDALGTGDLAGHREQVPDQALVFGLQLVQRRDMAARNYQNVRRRLRTQIAKRDDGIVFVDYVCRDLPGRNLAKNTVFHVYSHVFSSSLSDRLTGINAPTPGKRVRQCAAIDELQFTA